MNDYQPLRYQISSWRQLRKCRSNNDVNLVIHVTDFVNNELLEGFRISVDHPMFGTLFSCVLGARGRMVTPIDEYSSNELSSDDILAELYKYGFLITYSPNEDLGSAQIQYLMTLRGLGYDKIRILYVWEVVHGVQQQSPKVVAFQSSVHGDWLNNAYSPNISEFTAAINAGSAANLTYMSKTQKFRWDWLRDFVGNIDDILQDNADDMIHPEGGDSDGN